jgi:hypothetical protein
LGVDDEESFADRRRRGFPSYVNDIPQSMMEYVSDTTRERVRFRRSLNGYSPSQAVHARRYLTSTTQSSETS